MPDSKTGAPQIIKDKQYALGKGHFHPTACHWNVTYECNASCPYCYRDTSGIRQSSTNEALAIVDSIVNAGVMSLTISGGEPFLRHDICEIINHCATRDIFFLSVYTNGTVITEKHLSCLEKNQSYIQNVQMTAFSHKAEIHDHYCGVDGGFNRICSTIDTLNSIGIHVTIAIPIFDFNINDIQEIRDFFHNRHTNTRFSYKKRLSGTNSGNIDPYYESPAFFQALIEKMDSASREKEFSRMKDALTGKRRRSTFCGAIVKAVTIDPDGTVYACQHLRDHPLGNVLDQPDIVSMLKESEKLSELRSLRPQDVPRCHSCRYFDFCSICLADHYLKTGDMCKPDTATCAYAEAVHSCLTQSYAE